MENILLSGGKVSIAFCELGDGWQRIKDNGGRGREAEGDRGYRVTRE